MSIILSSPAFCDGGPIPSVYTGDDQDISPPLEWNAALAGVEEFALLCEDPDAPQTEPWTHWLVYKIPKDRRTLLEGLAKKFDPCPEIGLLQGKNSFGKFGWGGPLPPRGDDAHHYHFVLYALRAPIELPAGATKLQFNAALQGLVVDTATLTGLYQRHSSAQRAQERSRLRSEQRRTDAELRS